MSLARLFNKMQLSQADAEVIFDRDEPVGQPTDVVMPRRRWFRRSLAQKDAAKMHSFIGSAGNERRPRRTESSLSAADQQS